MIWKLPRPLHISAATCLITVVTFWPSPAQADRIDFVIDSTTSYLTLSIPNFSFSSTTFNIAGQNRTNGAPLATAWATTSGDKAFLSGSFSTTVGGSFYGGTVNSIQFVAGSSTLAAITSGNYRPNPAAYNASLTNPRFQNNSPKAADYGGIIHSPPLGNAALFSLSNTTYDLQTSSPLSVVGNQFPVNLSGNPLITGLSTTTFGLQEGSLPLGGSFVPDQLTALSGLAAGDTSSSTAKLLYAPGNSSATLTIPISVPFSIHIGGSLFLNGTATGQIVALSPIVPEPSTLALAAVGLGSLMVVIRRRRVKNVDGPS
jgi:hypothetical protein